MTWETGSLSRWEIRPQRSIPRFWAIGSGNEPRLRDSSPGAEELHGDRGVPGTQIRDPECHREYFQAGLFRLIGPSLMCIKYVLSAFGIPVKVIAIFRDIYTDFSTSVKTSFAPGHHRRSVREDRTPFQEPQVRDSSLGLQKKRTTLPTTFCIQEHPISGMRKKDTYCHFGVPIGYIKPGNLKKPSRASRKTWKKIHNSLLAPWQKNNAAKTIYPRLDFIFADPQWESNKVPFIPPFKDGAEKVPFGDKIDLAKIQHAFHLLASPDYKISALAKSLLKRDLKGYLSGKLDGDYARNGGDITWLWGDAINASRRLSKKIDTPWRFIHRARLNVLPLNGVKRFSPEDKRCRISGQPVKRCHTFYNIAANTLLGYARGTKRLKGHKGLQGRTMRPPQTFARL
ncbi:hypothetical protein LAZ67_14002108 [Cordylochernes scorpioides]|uniref:Uncharacterized protein n=1 Tax=Cordylochernes scorpioides TaxID=51811 RepID=A0ABY6L7I4_9ARAC|nr:hypothetical protein LAZ67_14002108 [Cordylochernes scorpioides]